MNSMPRPRYNGPSDPELISALLAEMCCGKSEILRRAGLSKSIVNTWRRRGSKPRMSTIDRLDAVLQERFVRIDSLIAQVRDVYIDGAHRELLERSFHMKSRDVPPFIREMVLERHGRRCFACGATERLAVDHVIPIVRGGDNHPTNLQCLCVHCNSSKGSWTMAEWMEKRATRGAVGANG